MKGGESREAYDCQKREKRLYDPDRTGISLSYSERELNPHKPFGLSDFKSDASTDSAIRAFYRPQGRVSEVRQI